MGDPIQFSIYVFVSSNLLTSKLGLFVQIYNENMSERVLFKSGYGIFLYL